MPAALTSGVAGVVFGLALAAPPGPMNAIIAEESVVRGWLSGFLAGLGTMTADVCFFVLSLLGVVTVLRRFPALKGVILAVGGSLMLYFAYGAVREAKDHESFVEDPDDAGKGFRKALVLALTNPYQILFWLTVGVGLLEPGRLDVFGEMPFLGDRLAGTLVVETGSPALLVGFFAGIVVWITGFPAVLVATDRRSDRFAPAVAYASAAVLAGFGIVFLTDAAAVLLR